jgi:glutamine amidotransferase
MCRIAGYLGQIVALDALLVRPARSLSVQARCPKEMPPGMIGSDGFGFGWFGAESQAPARYRSTLPIWVDENVDTMSPHLRSTCIVASSRTASRQMPVSMTNTPPFDAGGVLLVHNGAIHDFHDKVLESLRARLSIETRSHIFGNTDSEYLAALLHERTGDLAARVRETCAIAADAIRDAKVRGQLNLIVANGDELVATRYAVDDDAPSLWMRATADSFTVASEAMEENDGWTEVAPSTMITVRRGSAPVETALDA